MNWKYTDADRNVVYRVNEDGSMESCLVTQENVQEWVKAGNVIEEPAAPIVQSIIVSG